MNINKINARLLEVVKDYDISEYVFNDVLRSIRDKVGNNLIKKYNIHNVEKHGITPAEIIKDDTDFKEAEEKIKAHFEQFGAENRIKELMPYFKYEKVFNTNNQKYFSIWDYQKSLNCDNEKIRADIISKIDGLKEFVFCIYGLTDRYQKAQSLRDLNEFLKVAYGVSLEIENFSEWYNMDLKDFESRINAKDDKIKLRLFNEWFYLSFSDDRNEDLKKRVKDQLFKRMCKDE